MTIKRDAKRSKAACSPAQAGGGAQELQGPGLPADLLPAHVFRHLNHDALFCALQVCKAWHATSAAGPAALWEEHCRQRGWQLHEQQQQQQQQEQQQGEGQQEQQQQQGGPHDAAAAGHQQQPQLVDWRARYRQQYTRACYQCFQPTERHTLAVGSLRLRLCRDCSSATTSTQHHHRLLSETAAKTNYCLKQTDLDPLLRCVEPNPVDPAFPPMRLYRRLDVRRAAITRWGSWDAVQAEYWRRRKR